MKSIPGNLTESQQSLSLSLQTLSHYTVVVLPGNVLVKVAVGTSSEAVGPL